MLFKNYTRQWVFAVILIAIGNYGANAQQEQWDTYMADFNGKPGSVLVDMGLMAHAPDSRYPFIVITGPQAHNCGKKGIPDNDEIDAMEQVLDATTNFITGVTAKVLVGTFTYNCERLNYYYVKDTTGIRNAIYRLYNRNYKDYKFVVNMRHDPNWKGYISFLYPTDTIQNWMDNSRIVTDLIQHGDSLKQKRDITFAACFKTDSSRSAFSAYAVSKGYTIQKTPDTKSPTLPKCILFSTYNMVNIDTMNKRSAEIKSEVVKYNGTYNGWDGRLK